VTRTLLPACYGWGKRGRPLAFGSTICSSSARACRAAVGQVGHLFWLGAPLPTRVSVLSPPPHPLWCAASSEMWRASGRMSHGVDPRSSACMGGAQQCTVLQNTPPYRSSCMAGAQQCTILQHTRTYRMHGRCPAVHSTPACRSICMGGAQQRTVLWHYGTRQHTALATYDPCTVNIREYPWSRHRCRGKASRHFMASTDTGVQRR
jgi:hypothetical protein